MGNRRCECGHPVSKHYVGPLRSGCKVPDYSGGIEHPCRCKGFVENKDDVIAALRAEVDKLRESVSICIDERNGLWEEVVRLKAALARYREAVEWAERNYRAVMIDYDGPFLDCVDRAMKRHHPDHPINL